MEMRSDWLEYFRNIAEAVKLKSKDQSTKIGVVIVGKDNEIVSTGYNSFPRGIDDSLSERQERPEKYYWFSHAETNAIVNCARIGVSTKGCSMVMTCGVPCSDCARGIINSGISNIYVNSNDPLMVREKWKESVNRSLTMFEEAGVGVHYY